MEKNSIPFAILFIGTIVQTSTIFGFQGVLLAQFGGGMYLASYAVLALAGFLAPKDWRDSSPDMTLHTSKRRRLPAWREPERFSKVFLNLSLSVHVLFCSWAADTIFVVDAPLRELAEKWSRSEIVLNYTLFFAHIFASTFVNFFVSGICIVASVCLLGGICECLIEIPLMASILPSLGENLHGLPRLVLIFEVVLGYFYFVRIFLLLSNSTFFLGKNIEPSKYMLVAVLIRDGGDLAVFLVILLFAIVFLQCLGCAMPFLKPLKSVSNGRFKWSVFACWNLLLDLLYYRLNYDPREI
jgi:hypothetical protein